MLSKKLRIKPGTKIVTINAPKNYKMILGDLPENCSITSRPAVMNSFIHLFVKTKAEVEELFPEALKVLDEDGLMWISYPKGSSGMQTDLTRDKGWEALLKYDRKWLAMISLDDSWSAFLMKNTAAGVPTAASKAYHENSQAYADPTTKTVYPPDDLLAAFKKNPAARKFFDGLNYTSRKEYVLWVVSARREETRQARVLNTIKKLLEGKKVPAEK